MASVTSTSGEADFSNGNDKDDSFTQYVFEAMGLTSSHIMQRLIE